MALARRNYKETATRLRKRAREQTENVMETGAALGAAFAYGYGRAKGNIDAEYAGIDSDLLIGSLASVMGLGRGRYSGMGRAVGHSMLGVWFAGYGDLKAREVAAESE